MACLVLHNEKGHCSFQTDAAIRLFWYMTLQMGTNYKRDKLMVYFFIFPHLRLTDELVGLQDKKKKKKCC